MKLFSWIKLCSWFEDQDICLKLTLESTNFYVKTFVSRINPDLTFQLSDDGIQYEESIIKNTQGSCTQR